MEADSGARWRGDRGPTQETQIPAVDAGQQGLHTLWECRVSKDDVPPIGLRYHRPPGLFQLCEWQRGSDVRDLSAAYHTFSPPRTTKTRPLEGPRTRPLCEKLGCGTRNWPVRGLRSFNITCRNAMRMQGPLHIFTSFRALVGGSPGPLGRDWIFSTLLPSAASASNNPVLPEEVKFQRKIQLISQIRGFPLG